MRHQIAVLLIGLASSHVLAGDAPEAIPKQKATIYFSAAPWDGAAYDLEIPLEKYGGASNPVIRVSIWGNPEFDGPQTLVFTGKEDSGGGDGKGAGRVLYQRILNKSLPENLSGTIAFESLKHGKPFIAVYDLTTAKGKNLKGKFHATWGNASAGLIR